MAKDTERKRYMISLDVGAELHGRIMEMCQHNQMSKGAVIRLLIRKALNDNSPLEVPSPNSKVV